VELRSEGLLATRLSLLKICSLSGLSRSTVKRALKKLFEEEWVRIRPSFGESTTFILGVLNDGEEQWFVEMEETVELPFEVDSSPGDIPEGVQREPGTGFTENPVGGSERTRYLVHREPGGGVRENHISSSIKEDTKRDRKKKVRRVRAKTSPPPEKKPAAPEVPEGKIDEKHPDRGPVNPTELRHLLSARAKVNSDQRRKLSGQEAIAVWRFQFWRAFGIEDPDLSTEAARSRMSRTFTSRTRQWCGGDRERLLRYLRAQIALWENKPKGEKWPPGEAPRLETLLKHEKKGPSWFWREWSVKESKSAP
jgi:hypothetical protein